MANEGTRSYLAALDMEPGTELGTSAWHEVTQEDISAFAKLTRDEDAYHVDPEFARENSPLGTTISFGFLTMSMLTCFSHEVFGRAAISAEADGVQLFNLGFNRLRFPEPVPVGSMIRGRFTLKGVRTRENGGVEFTTTVVVEIKGNDRPALAGEWLGVAVSTE